GGGGGGPGASSGRGCAHPSRRDPPWPVPRGGAASLPSRHHRPRRNPGALRGGFSEHSPAQGAGGPAVSTETSSGGGEASARGVEIPSLLPVLPLREGVIFPMAVAPVVVQDERAVRAVEDAMRTHRMRCAVARREGDANPNDPRALYSTGSAVAIQQFQRGPEGPILIVLQGLERLQIQRFPQTDPYLIAAVEQRPDQPSSGTETEA